MRVSRSAPAFLPGARPMLLLLTGLLIVQLSWVLCVRPFAGIDEFAHADRAAAVARGEWAPRPSHAVHNSGAWVTVPTSLVQAARAECRALPYTQPAECEGRPAERGMTRVGTSAGRYNPLFYAVVGYASLPFSGTTALLAMRLAAATCCWLMLLLACLATRRWAKTSWPFLGIALCCTPVVIYSSAVVAPNALEICSGITLWCALLGLLRAGQQRPDPVLLASFAISGAVLVLLRPLGPGWAGLILVTAVLAARVDRRTIARLTKATRVWVAALVVFSASLAGVGWTIVMHATHLSTSAIPATPLTTQIRLTAVQVPLWLLQSIAAFPYRNEPTATVVYVAYMVLGVGLVAMAGRALRRDRRSLVALLLTITIAVVLPAVSTLMTFDQYGTSWQGRYGLPYTVGTLLLLTWTLDRTHRPVPWRVFGPALALYATAQTVSVVNTLQRELATDPLHGTGDWLAPPGVLLAGVAALGSLLILAGARSLAQGLAVDPSSGTRSEDGSVVLPGDKSPSGAPTRI